MDQRADKPILGVELVLCLILVDVLMFAKAAADIPDYKVGKVMPEWEGQ